MVEDIVKALEAGEEVDFYYWAPISKSTIPGDEERKFYGIASTGDLDLQNEVVHPDGLDVEYFKNFGFFNDDHKGGPENKIGEPTLVELRPEGLYVEGFLYKNHPKADAYWSLLNSLGSTDSRRKIGLSIEGKVKRRNGNRVMAAWVKDVAVTCSPVNTNTFVEVMKALTAMNKAEAEKCETCGMLDCKCEHKSMSTQSASALVKESLDRDAKLGKSLSYDEAVEHVEGQLKVNRQMAEVITSFAFNKHT
jgi:hypothetical protein